MTEKIRRARPTLVQPLCDHDAEVVCGTPFAVVEDGFVRPAATPRELALFRGLDDRYTLK